MSGVESLQRELDRECACGEGGIRHEHDQKPMHTPRRPWSDSLDHWL